MSNKRDREKRREQRLEEESRVETQDRRARLLQFGAGAVFLAIIAVVVLIVVNSSSSSSSGGDAGNLKEVSQVDKLFAGIPQKHLELGDPNAPVTLYEYGDPQCPICKEYSEEILPPIFENQIREGKAKIIFRNFIIIGPQSPPAGAAALAAGEQGRGWNYLELFYRNQGEENSGYVTDEFMTSVAEASGVNDLAKWNKDRKSTKLTNEVQETTEQAQHFGFTGTPSFAIKGPKTNGLELLGTPGSTEVIEEKIAQAG